MNREHRATERRIKEAALPVWKTTETFDFTAQVSLKKPLVRQLLRGEYINKRENLLLIGNPGTGKTHLATALGLAACSQRKRVRFTTTTGLVTELLEQPLLGSLHFFPAAALAGLEHGINNVVRRETVPEIRPAALATF